MSADGGLIDEGESIGVRASLFMCETVHYRYKMSVLKSLNPILHTRFRDSIF
jgi:hypothetical protein